jgi:hypothetical protein
VPLLSPLLLLLAETGVAGSVRTEVQAGEAPMVSSSTSSSFFGAALVRPEISLTLPSATTDTSVSEAPRLFWQKPNMAGRDRPLFLNTFLAEHKGQRGQRLSWDLRLLSIAGEVNYAALNQILNRQAALPDAMALLTLDGVGSVGWRFSRRLSLRVEAGVLRRQPLGSSSTDASSAAGFGLPTETDERIEPRLDYALSRRQIASLRLRLTNYRLTGSIQLWAMAAELRLGWRYKLTRHHQLELAAGLAAATALERPDAERPWTPFAPLAEIALVSSVPLSRTMMLRGRAGGEVLWYLDPILGVSLPRGQVIANLVVESGLSWTAEVYFLAATNLSRQPLVGSPIETFISAGVPLRYRIERHWALELGGRYSERGPHLDTPGFSLQQRELVGYLALVGTTR